MRFNKNPWDSFGDVASEAGTDQATGAQVSFQQASVWLHGRVAEDPTLYNLVFCRRFPGGLDETAARQAVDAIVRRHAVLRVRFRIEGGRILQQVDESAQVPWSTVHAEELDETAQEARLAQCLAAADGHVLDVANGPLLRLDHVRLGQSSALILSVHHIVFDAWSMDLFEREFDAFYAAALHNQPCELPAPELSYFDYCRAQQAIAQGEGFQRQLEYWRTQLDGLPATHALPLDAPRPLVRRRQGRTHNASLPIAHAQGLHALAASLNASLFMVIHALFATMIARHGNQADVAIGVPFAKRTSPDGDGAGLEGLIGMFADPMVLRVDCHGACSFAALVQAVRTVSIDAYANSDVPFVTLVQTLLKERTEQVPPLFQIMLNMGEARVYDGQDAGFQLVPGDLANYDLSLNVNEAGGTLHFSFNYDADVFGERTIATFQRHLFRLAEAAIAAPDKNIYELEMLAPQERDELLVHALAAETPAAHGLTSLLERFHAQVGRTPDQVALVDAHDAWTFAQLARTVDAVAAQVVSHVGGLTRGDEFLVALHGPRSNALVAQMLGVLQAGGAFVCLDPRAPLQRNRFILEDAAPTLLISAEPALWQAQLPAGVRLLEAEVALSGEAAPHTAFQAPRPDAMMYVVYTSGSTGVPKGVVVEHRHLASFLPGFQHQCAALGVAAPAAWLLNQSFTFDPSLIGLALLCQGTRLVVLTEAQMMEPVEILRLVEQHGVPIFKSSPALAVALIDQVNHAGHAPHLIVGGDDTSPSALAKIQDYCRRYDRRAVNAYGPTETTINCTFDRIGDTLTLGRPMPGCTAYVLGERMSLLPRGSVGELYIGGGNVARGYLHRADLTAQAFVRDPFAGDPRARLYRTGDYVRQLDDGRLQFVGRRDAQVKIRGYRVEVGEVERAIKDTGLVQDVRVLFKAQTQQLLAFVIPGPNLDAAGPEVLHQRIGRALADTLPAYMHPARYSSLAAWPTTRHGKLDRQALLASETLAMQAAGRAPAGELEIKLAQAWSELLAVPQEAIATDSCFFRLGGHSLIAILLVAKVHELLGCTLQVRDVLEHSRFGEMVERIRTPSATALTAIARQPTAARYPASYSQNKFWFVDNLSQGGKHFNIVLRVGLPGDCDEALVHQALNAIVHRHEALRTGFEYADGLWQVVHAPGACAFSVADLTGLAPQARERQWLALLEGEYALRRDLRTGPLFSATLVRLPDAAHLLLNVHHIASDAWSNQVLVEEFGHCHDALLRGEPIDLPALPIQYRDYAAWQQQSIQAKLPALEAYWQTRLDALPAVHALPLDFARPASPSSVGAYHVQQVPQALHEGLSSLYLDHRTTLFVGLQALFSAFLARLSGQDDIVLGTATANRNHPDTRQLIGALVDTLVLRNSVRPEHSFLQHLAATREQHLADQAHFELPFETLVRAINPERDSGYSPLFQLVLNLAYSDSDIPEFDREATSALRRSINVNYDLTLYAGPTGQGLELTWCYATDLFKPETIARMAASFETLLAAVVADPSRALSSLPLVAEDERAALVALAEGPAPTRDSALLPELIASQARNRGDAPALVLDDEQWSYAQLAARANQIARTLLAAGVQRGDRVGVCQERTLDMLASVIGTMSAGAVYVPLDPGYPDERLAYLLDDAGISHVLTEAYLAAQLPLAGQRVVRVSDADDQDASALNSAVTRDTIAYMIYTSGSTGQPKGVAISHGAYADKLVALAQHYELTENDRSLLFASMSFDASLSQLGAVLSVGGSVALRPDAVTEPEALLAYVTQQRVTWMHVVPAYLRQLVEVKGWEKTSLTRVTSGGDVLDAGLQQAWFTPERAGIALYNSYGPTEIAITSSSYRLRGDEAVAPIGRPLANTRYWVLDAQGGLLPRGAVGELCIGGSGLAQGYWKREAQTQERFVEVNLTGTSERVYRSGDRVRWNEDGQLEFVGRSDHQVKVRGYRIELGEIEAALQACNGVTGAVVKVEDDGLWAYVATSGDLSQVEVELASRLPGYLLPSGYERVTEWPLTRSGKIDRKALKRGQAISLRRTPNNAVEEALLEIWSALLKSDDIGVTDNFFQRGGHSLLATRLASQIRKRFEVDFTLKSLFELPSIEEQAVFIEVLRRKGTALAQQGEGNEGMEAVEEFSL